MGEERRSRLILLAEFLEMPAWRTTPLQRKLQSGGCIHIRVVVSSVVICQQLELTRKFIVN